MLVELYGFEAPLKWFQTLPLRVFVLPVRLLLVFPLAVYLFLFAPFHWCTKCKGYTTRTNTRKTYVPPMPPMPRTFELPPIDAIDAKENHVEIVVGGTRLAIDMNRAGSLGRKLVAIADASVR